MSPGTDSVALKGQLLALGFDRVGFARAEPARDFDRFEAWLERGHAGPLHYLARRRELRADPRALLPEARSLVLVSLNYHVRDPGTLASARAGRGWISRYAWGRDYHKVLRARLKRAAALLADTHGARQARVCVDSAPLLERSLAAAAGLGWIGKNTLLIDEELGSYTFLGALLTDLDLPPDAPVAERCGRCLACLEACPTGALRPEEPGCLDARRCISTLSVEQKGEFLPGQPDLLGDHLFGCDLCQEVCPWNGKAPETGEPDFLPREGLRRPLLSELLSMDEAGFLKRFAGTAVMRAGIEGLRRNVRAVRANQAKEAQSE